MAASQNSQRVQISTDHHSIGDRFELKVNIEAMSRCPGSCMGCLMTPEERKFGGFWDGEMFDLAERFVGRWIDIHRARLDAAEEFEVAVNIGQGDHMAVAPLMADRAMQFIGSVYDRKSVAFITASALAERSRLAAAASHWKAVADRMGQSFYADVVFDPAMYSRDGFRDSYRENIATLRRVFSEVDLNINLGPDTIQHISPRELHEFVCANQFRILTLNFVPTLANVAQMKEAFPAILDWLCELIGIWMPLESEASPPYALNTFSTVALNAFLMRRNEGLGEAADLEWLAESLADSLSRLLFIDHHGNVSFTQAGIGDFPIGDRTGGRIIGNLRDLADDEHLPARIEAGARNLAARIITQQDLNPVCAACAHRHVCAMTGGTQLSRLFGDIRPEGCPTGIIRVYDAIFRYSTQQILVAGSGLRPGLGINQLV